MNYEDWEVHSCEVQTVGSRQQKRCYITNGQVVELVICRVDDDPILVYMQAEGYA